MEQENAAHNEFLLSSPIIVSAAFTGLQNNGRPHALLINMCLTDDGPKDTYADQIILPMPLTRHLCTEIKAILASQKVPDYRTGHSTINPLDIPPENVRAFVEFNRQMPEQLFDDCLTNVGRQTMRFCHFHYFGQLLVFEFVALNGDTRPFGIFSTVAYEFADRIDEIIRALDAADKSIR